MDVNPLPRLLRAGQEKIPSPFLERSEEHVGVEVVFAIFCHCTGSDTASCEDFEEYEFLERLSEETQIVGLFTHCKLQPHTLSQ